MKKYDRFLRRAVVGPVASLAVPLSRSPMTWASPDRATAASVAAAAFVLGIAATERARDDGGVGSARGRRCAQVQDLEGSWPLRFCDPNGRVWA